MAENLPTSSRRRLSPALVLFFLSPMVGELLSSSAPPAEFFNPVGFLMLSVLYGGGAILVRELVLLWGKGWPSLLALGAAYGIAEEGLMCKSFFDPGWMDVGMLGWYGRWLGVNWVWAFELTIYHAAFSILIPITLTGLIFPDRRQHAWTSTRRLWLLFAVWTLNGLVIFLAISKYHPSGLHLGAAFLAIAGLCVLARRLPWPVAPRGQQNEKLGRPWRLAILGFVGTMALFLLAWALPATRVHPTVVIGSMVLLVVVLVHRLWRLSGRNGFSDAHRLALISGALGLFILVLAPVREWSPNQPDNPTGMSIVALAALVFLLWLRRRMRSRLNAGSAGVTAPQ